jgi:hypothetical protein
LPSYLPSENKSTEDDPNQNGSSLENIVSSKKKMNLVKKDKGSNEEQAYVVSQSASAELIKEPPIKPFEFTEDSNALGATDDDVGDSLIELESDYTEIEEDSDSLASLTNIKTSKTEVPQKIEEKVCTSCFCS